MRKLIYFVAVSIDGYIAGPDDELGFIVQAPELVSAVFEAYPETCPAHAREPLGVTGEGNHFDAVVMGRRTQQPALDIGVPTAYPHLDNHVITRQRDLPAHEAVTYVTDDVVQHVRSLKAQPGKGIWLAGGGEIAGLLADEIDELHLKVSPALAGAGIPLASTTRVQQFALASSRALPGGVLLNVYQRPDPAATA